MTTFFLFFNGHIIIICEWIFIAVNSLNFFFAIKIFYMLEWKKNIKKQKVIFVWLRKMDRKKKFNVSFLFQILKFIFFSIIFLIYYHFYQVSTRNDVMFGGYKYKHTHRHGRIFFHFIYLQCDNIV